MIDLVYRHIEKVTQEAEKNEERIRATAAKIAGGVYGEKDLANLVKWYQKKQEQRAVLFELHVILGEWSKTGE